CPDGELSYAGSLDRIADEVVGAHFRRKLCLDLFGVGPPKGDLDERVFLLKRRRQRAQRLIDDHGGVICELALLLGAFDEFLRAILPTIGEDAFVRALRRRRGRQQARREKASQKSDPKPSVSLLGTACPTAGARRSAHVRRSGGGRQHQPRLLASRRSRQRRK